jgi:chromosome segregation ATPase
VRELTGAYEAGERRIEELVAQVHEREEELRGVGARVEDLSGRLASAEERLDDRERRLEELFRQVERRDSALSAFEAKLDGIAAQFAGELEA